ncbi:MAG: hypothetical protein KAH48_03215 [Chlorobi bacterium]|nr:hypothetical protein [Chlorobiota bacterium]
MKSNKSNESNRTIERVLDLETEKEITALNFFKEPEDIIFQIRTEIEKTYQSVVDTNNDRNKRYVCYYCKQMVKINGKGIKREPHFAHFRDSDDCHIKTNTKFTKDEIERIKYNGAKESIAHKTIKEFVFNQLTNDKNHKDVGIEKILRSEKVPNKWRKPDVSSNYLSKKIVYEVQLSTTFLSVIVGRSIYYENENIYLLWIFNKFTPEDKITFSQKDVYYNNNNNVFVLNEEAQKRSKLKNELVFCCHYRKPYKDGWAVEYEWETEYVTMSDLTYDSKIFIIYYYDVESNVKKLQSKIEIEQKIIIADSEIHYLKVLIHEPDTPYERIIRFVKDYKIKKKLNQATLDNFLDEKYKKSKSTNLSYQIKDNITLSYFLSKNITEEEIFNQLIKDKELFRKFSCILSLIVGKLLFYPKQNVNWGICDMLDKYQKSFTSFEKIFKELKLLKNQNIDRILSAESIRKRINKAKSTPHLTSQSPEKSDSILEKIFFDMIRKKHYYPPHPHPTTRKIFPTCPSYEKTSAALRHSAL